MGIKERVEYICKKYDLRYEQKYDNVFDVYDDKIPLETALDVRSFSFRVRLNTNRRRGIYYDIINLISIDSFYAETIKKFYKDSIIYNSTSLNLENIESNFNSVYNKFSSYFYSLDDFLTDDSIFNDLIDVIKNLTKKTKNDNVLKYKNKNKNILIGEVLTDSCKVVTNGISELYNKYLPKTNYFIGEIKSNEGMKYEWLIIASFSVNSRYYKNKVCEVVSKISIKYNFTRKRYIISYNENLLLKLKYPDNDKILVVYDLIEKKNIKVENKKLIHSKTKRKFYTNSNVYNFIKDYEIYLKKYINTI